MAVVPPNHFLCRADYDYKKKILKPPYDKWEGRSCSCNRPTNPLMTYIACDGCDAWFHPECQGTTADVESFLCKNCNNSNNPS